MTDQDVEKLARAMAAATGQHDPNKIVYSWPPYEILTPHGRVYEALSTGCPLWRCYTGMARVALEQIEKRSNP